MPMASPELPHGAELIAQGAEARLYGTVFLDQQVVVKERFRKAYRHPTLDDKLTKERIGWEARCLQRARKCGVDAPLIIFVDGINHRIYMERVPGVTVKAYLQDVQQRRKQLLEGSTTTTTPEAAAEILARDDAAVERLAVAIGAGIARLHESAGMTHGDLTSSNIILRGCPGPSPLILTSEGGSSSSSSMSSAAASVHPDNGITLNATHNYNASSSSQALGPSAGDVQMSGASAAALSSAPTNYDGAFSAITSGIFEYPVTFIDFGLSRFTLSAEDRAVDLYVLERACSSAHSDRPLLFDGILRGYMASVRDPKPISAKFEQVRQRGRKRLAFG